ncbi:ATP-binding protein [Brevibacillus thermoruber]|uniref:ATP-binding protein n=1 Tax=Brevibacillus thermoruber TaxID=33942 RepID=UPI000404A80C|nr:sensor histidine kinase [Brevibacillus thermoruber]
MRFQSKLILVICTLLLCVIAILGCSFEYMLANALKKEIGTRALHVAETVAAMPEIKRAFSDSDPSRTIAPLAEKIRRETHADFVTVGNREGIRYSHPIPERIGKKMQGGDNQPVFAGQSIVSETTGSLGPALRGKAPIFNEAGQVIGVVSVGFLLEDVQKTIHSYRDKIFAIGLIALALGVIGTLWIARSVKQAIFGLEPSQIGQLYQEKQAILESIREGIVAVNASGTITMANQTALQLLGLDSSKEITGKPADEILDSFRLLEVLKAGRAIVDQETWMAGHVLVVNCVPILDAHNQIVGAVASFRDKSELYRVIEELSRVKEYAEALRAQTHEYSNKLYLISGLIQLESYREAIEFITRETDVHVNHTRFIMREIPDPIIGGLLLGKLNRASERKVKLEIDRESSFRDIPAWIDRHHLITIMGNLVDNALEAVLAPGAFAREVNVFLTDIGEVLLIEVEDRGPGIPDEHADRLFELGFSTKAQKNHGFGLALVKQAVEQLNGNVSHTPNPDGGTIFTVVIPKEAEAARRGKGTP